MAASSPLSPPPRQNCPHRLQLSCPFSPSQWQGANEAPPLRGWRPRREDAVPRTLARGCRIPRCGCDLHGRPVAAAVLSRGDRRPLRRRFCVPIDVPPHPRDPVGLWAVPVSQVFPLSRPPPSAAPTMSTSRGRPRSCEDRWTCNPARRFGAGATCSTCVGSTRFRPIWGPLLRGGVQRRLRDMSSHFRGGGHHQVGGVGCGNCCSRGGDGNERCQPR